jgi:hypothetical protein
MEMNRPERLEHAFDSFNSKADPVERWFLLETLRRWDKSWESLDSDLRREQLHFPLAADGALDAWERLGMAPRARIAGWVDHG